MRCLLTVIALAGLCLGANAYGKRAPYIVEIADPYIELHTGPGRGYPIFHVLERGDTVEVRVRRTDWFKVRGGRGERSVEGWVSAGQLAQTLQPDG
ncbi:MAG: SH3 domain-containing protein, partial [Gammaproteobacteria bacterium]